MKQIILKKVEEIKKEMSKLEYIHLYYLNPEWMALNSKLSLLEEILTADSRAYNIAVIKDIQGKL